MLFGVFAELSGDGGVCHGGGSFLEVGLGGVLAAGGGFGVEGVAESVAQGGEFWAGELELKRDVGLLCGVHDSRE